MSKKDTNIALSRKQLQTLCKKYGIKANISNKHIIDCINMQSKGIQIPEQYKKLSWFDKHKLHILYAITLLSLSTTAIISYAFYKKTRI